MADPTIHLETVVPFLQLTYAAEPYTDPDDPTITWPYTYTLAVSVPIHSHYTLQNVTTTLGSYRAYLAQGEAENFQVAFKFQKTSGYDPTQGLGVTHVLRQFRFPAEHEPAHLPAPFNTMGAIVTVETLEEDGTPANPTKKGRMQLEEAEMGVDPKVQY